MQQCTKCRRLLPLDDFYRSPSGRFGRRTDCKSCVNAARRQRRQEAKKPASGSGVLATVGPIRTATRAAETGNFRDMLLAARDRIYNTVIDPKTHPRDIPGLTKELSRLAAELEHLDDGSQASGPQTVDDEPFSATEL